MNSGLKLVTKISTKQNAHRLTNFGLTKQNKNTDVLFSHSKEGRENHVKALEVYRVKTLEVYHVKTLEVYHVIALEVYHVKTLGVYHVTTLEVFFYQMFTRGDKAYNPI